MKKKILKIISCILGISALCGLLFLTTLNSKNKRVLSANASDSIPSTTISNVDEYYGIESFDGRFFFDWDFLTYNVSNNSNNNSSRSYRAITTKPTSLYGLVWVGSLNNITREGLSGDRYTYGNAFQFQFYVSGNPGFYNYTQLTLFDGISIYVNYPDHLYTNVNFIPQGQYGYPNTYGVAYNGTSSNPVTKWFSSYLNVFYIISNPSSDILRTDLINWMWENGTLYNWYDFYNTSENSQSIIDDLEDEVSDLEDEVSSLETEITSLESEITTLSSQLQQSASNTRNNTYIVSVHIDYTLTMDFYTKIGSPSYYYVKPKRFVANSIISVSNASGQSELYESGIVDTISYNNNNYYYDYNNLYYYLYPYIDDNWLLNYRTYNANSDNIFDDSPLTNLNYYLQDWILDFKTDLMYTDNNYFRSIMTDYSYMLNDFSNMNNADYTFGYEDGYNNGYDVGHNDGYSQGFNGGYNAGFNEGASQDETALTIFQGILGIGILPVNIFLKMLNFRILGINIASFASALISVALTIIVIRTVMGKK